MDKKSMAKILRELRGEKKREEIAMAVGVTAQAICNYESGARVPSDEIKLRLAEYYHRPVGYIFYGESQQNV